jgi:GNAT superfamily N-acetyltransferase
MPRLSFLSEPSARQIVQITGLYRQAGWWDENAPDDPDLVARIVAGSHCFVIASHSKTIIGMGRAISDRASDGYLQDIMVQQAYRRQGLGSRIVAKLIDRLHHDGISWIGVIAENNTRPFYDSFSFSPMQKAMPLIKKQ